MGGGLLQLVAHGAQDAYLTGNPQITFWKGMFKRHTNFAMEPFRINLTGMPAWGAKQSATLGRHADLLYSTYLEIIVPAVTRDNVQIYWNNEQGRLGYNLIDHVDLEIGGQIIDRHYSEYLYLWDTLTHDYTESVKLHRLVGLGRTAGYLALSDSLSCSVKTGRPGHPWVMDVPLPFFYTKNPGAALPLIALQYHEVKINIVWNKSQFVGTVNASAPTNSTLISSLVAPPPPSSVSLYVDYIYLDVDERRRMAQESHEYLIEQVQFNEDKGLGSAQARIDLTFNHPVKELIWVVQPDRFTNCKIADKAVGDGVPRPNTSRLTPFTYTYANQLATPTFTQAVYQQKIQINGQDRMDIRYGDYFNKVQNYQHHTGGMDPDGFSTAAVSNGGGGTVTAQPTHHQSIYNYSFALKPEENQPSGTCNFSRIDTATIVLNMSGDYVVDESTDNSWNVRVYAINYNILRIMSGMAGLAYSN